ncbi:MAG: hypothetical protein WBE28_05530 [bacterium]
MKKRIPLILIFIAGLLGVISFVIPHPSYQVYDEWIRNDLLRVLSSFAVVLALGSLVRVHSDKIRRRRRNWQYSWLLLIAFAVSAVIGLFGGVAADGILPTMIGSFSFDIQTLYENIVIPLASSMFALLAFFMASAAYRAFRVRSMEATLLLTAAFIVMIGVLPIGYSISKYLPAFVQWILNVPNVAGQRGIVLGIALGVVATSLKIILGIERAWLGGGE